LVKDKNKTKEDFIRLISGKKSLTFQILGSREREKVILD
jgi:hypothetical protein